MKSHSISKESYSVLKTSNHFLHIYFVIAGLNLPLSAKFEVLWIFFSENISVVLKFNSNFSARHMSMSFFCLKIEEFQPFLQMMHDIRVLHSHSIFC